MIFKEQYQLGLVKYINSPSKRNMQGTMLLFFISLLTCLLWFSAVHADDASPMLAQGDEYRIGAEDVLQISVWKEPELQREVIVRPDGGISFPLAGDVMAAGRTPKELQDEITTRLAKYIPDAVVTVAVTKLTGLRIYVIGKVNSPGQYVIGRYVDVLQALTLAGGMNPYAKQKEIKILRRVEGKEVAIPFNYSAVRDGENLGQNIRLQNNDVVVVP